MDQQQVMGEWGAAVVEAEAQAERDRYDLHKRRMAAKSRAHSQAGRDIGDLLPVVNAARRESALSALGRYMTTYYPRVFYLPFSRDHFKVLDILELVIRRGGFHVLAMARGAGKTRFVNAAAEWSVLAGLHSYVCPLGASQATANRQLMRAIKAHLLFNSALMEDFPEVCQPIRACGNVANRANGQLYHGQLTSLEWGKSTIVFPWLPPELIREHQPDHYCATVASAARSQVIDAVGMDGNIRGKSHSCPDGTEIRPSLAIPDDPQTRKSAQSIHMSEELEAIVSGDVAYMAGPDRAISLVMPATVICRGDLPDRLLDREKHPEWHGLRLRALPRFPDHMRLWENYWEILQSSLRNDQGHETSTSFYRTRQAACGLHMSDERPCRACERYENCMDAGAVVAWPERFRATKGEISGLQMLMNEWFRDPRAFSAEMQQEPETDNTSALDLLRPDEICSRLTGEDRFAVPPWAQLVTAYVDVAKEVLFYVVAAWGPGLRGAVIDYGPWPDQQRAVWSKRDLRVPLSSVVPGGDLGAAITTGLVQLCGRILSREYVSPTGIGMKVELCGIDANWGDSTEIVYQFCRTSDWASVLMPCHGRGVTAKNAPMELYKARPGEKLGTHWVRSARGRHGSRHLLIDTNWWKTKVHERLALPVGDGRGLALFGRNPNAHRLLAQHLVAEQPVITSHGGRSATEWELGRGRPDNEGLDCLVGAAVCASVRGIDVLAAPTTGPAQPRPAARRRRRVLAGEWSQR